VERIRRRDRRIAAPGDRVEAVEPDPGSPGRPSRSPGRYVLVERDGAPPEPDMLLELSEFGEEIVLVDRVGRSPLPGDTRPCAFAQQQLSPSDD
jgi:hypothetical protein